MNWELEFKRCLEKRWLVTMTEARYLVEKELKAARDDLAEAEASYQRSGYKWSTIQTYYAMFHAVEALMLDRDLSFSKHSAVIAAFGKKFVKTGIFDSRFHRSLLNAFDLRNAGDYGITHSACKEKANQTIAEAGELLSEIKRHLAAD